MSDDIKQRALSGLFWAMLQNWSGKGLGLLLFLILARLLTPTQLGVAAAINVVIVLVSLIAEQGFSDAIVQRRNLKDEDINLPFYSSLLISSVLALVVVLLSSRIEQWMNVPGLAPLLSVATASLPLAAMTMFQEAIYRRKLLFRQVAIRMLVNSTIAGIVAIGCAYAGMGSWSLVVQALVMNALNVLWLWHKPLWRPTRDLNPGSYGEIARFSGSVLASRVLDVIGTRSIDLLIAALHGPAALGLYAVGSRIFQTMMQLLSASVTNVSLGALSLMALDLSRLQRAYLKTIAASAAVAVPAFVAVAAVSPELIIVLFGKKWADSGHVMTVLMVLGALQCVQFANGPTFGALGRPHYLAWLALLKAATAILAMWLVPTDNVVELTVVYAVSQLVATPLTFALLMRCLHLGFGAIAKQMLPFYFAAGLAFAAVYAMRIWLMGTVGLIAQLSILLLVYACAYVLAALMFGLSQLRQLWLIFRK